MTREYKKREKITAATFDFTMQKLQYQIEYQGKGKAPDKRFDKLTQGLCLFIQPNGSKTFYAVKSMEMFNKKKNRMERNAWFTICSVLRVLNSLTSGSSVAFAAGVAFSRAV